MKLQQPRNQIGLFENLDNWLVDERCISCNCWYVRGTVPNSTENAGHVNSDDNACLSQNTFVCSFCSDSPISTPSISHLAFSNVLTVQLPSETNLTSSKARCSIICRKVLTTSLTARAILRSFASAVRTKVVE